MNRGTVGFLMNAYEEDGLIDRLSAAEEAKINPLSMTAVDVEGHSFRPCDKQCRCCVQVPGGQIENFRGWA